MVNPWLDELARPPAMRPLTLTHGFTGEAVDRRTCATVIRRGSKSFHFASLLLPKRTREAAQALYAFCRHADDLVDAAGAPPSRLGRLRERLDRIYAGDPMPIACDRAFGRAVLMHGVPKAVPAALLDGFAMDLSGRRYETIAEVKAYATCVAASVGVMMALVMGAARRDALARAADLGIAMQLTNIARDVGEDARNGRLYLPADWLRQAGIDPSGFLANPRFDPALGMLIERMLDEADKHYILGMTGIDALPPDCRTAIRSAAAIYRAIGDEIRKAGFNSVDIRARTRLGRKIRLALAARAGRTHHDRVAVSFPPEPAAVHLVEIAAAAHAALRDEQAAAPRDGLPLTQSGADRFLVIVGRLKQRERDAARKSKAGHDVGMA